VEVETFDVAYNIIGGGEEGDKTTVFTKEQADHSLPYVIAVAILDGRVMPEQYKQERIRRADVQALLGKVSVQSDASFSERFPNEMPCRIKITLNDGRVLEQETKDYAGFFARPMSCEMAIQKFNEIATPHASAAQRSAIADAVANLEQVSVRQLMQCLAAAGHNSDPSRIAGVHRES
jgi:2-methylcitrate dehydratase